MSSIESTITAEELKLALQLKLKKNCFQIITVYNLYYVSLTSSSYKLYSIT